MPPIEQFVAFDCASTFELAETRVSEQNDNQANSRNKREFSNSYTIYK